MKLVERHIIKSSNPIISACNPSSIFKGFNPQAFLASFKFSIEVVFFYRSSNDTTKIKKNLQKNQIFLLKILNYFQSKQIVSLEFKLYSFIPRRSVEKYSGYFLK